MTEPVSEASRRGRSNARKGKDRERQLVKMCEAAGLRAHRVPGSGGFGTRGGNMSVHDVIIEEFECEVKARGNGDGFKTLERWKGNADFLCLWRDYAKPMVVLDFDLFAALVSRAKAANVLPAPEQPAEPQRASGKRARPLQSRPVRPERVDRTKYVDGGAACRSKF